MSFGAWFWITLFSVGTVFEVWTLFFKLEWALSYVVWQFRNSQGAQGLFTFFIAIVLWSLYHFLVEGPR